MKLGVKIFDDEKFLDYFEDKADFFEVQGICGNDYGFLKKYSKPIVIHAEHFKQGSNPADESKERENLKSINFSRRLADKVGAKKIILHPGRLMNRNCSLDNAVKFFKRLRDKRVIIENCYSDGSIVSTPEDAKRFMKESGADLCFDISHAIVCANRLKVDYILFMKEFLKLKPRHFHIGGQKMSSRIDSHCSFGDLKSDIDLKKVLSYYPKNAWLTLEVTTSIKKTEFDLGYVRKVVEGL